MLWLNPGAKALASSWSRWEVMHAAGWICQVLKKAVTVDVVVFGSFGQRRPWDFCCFVLFWPCCLFGLGGIEVWGWLAFAIGDNLSATLPETNSSSLKWMVGRLLSFWEGLFSGVMLVSGRVKPFVLILAKDYAYCIELMVGDGGSCWTLQKRSVRWRESKHDHADAYASARYFSDHRIIGFLRVPGVQGEGVTGEP